MLEMRMAGEVDLAGDLDRLGFCFDAVELDRRRTDQFDALQSLEEIEMPPGTAEFAVGSELQADLRLLLDDLLDLAVFDFAQRVGGNPAFGKLGARLFQRSRPQQAADVIGAERRGRPRAHLPQTSCERSTIILSLAHCSSSASTLPSSVEAKPHCGERQS